MRRRVRMYRALCDPHLIAGCERTSFFALLGGTLLCMMILFTEQWTRHERLVFPLVRLPLHILGEG